MNFRTLALTGTAILVVLGAVQVIGGSIVGSQAKARLEAYAETQTAYLQDIGYAGSSVAVTAYESGLFSSSGVVSSQITLPGAEAAGPLVLDVPFQMTHGPVILDGHGLALGLARMTSDVEMIALIDSALASLQAAQMEDVTGLRDAGVSGAYTVTSHATIGFDGGFSGGCAADAAQLSFTPEDGEGGTIAIGAIQSCVMTVSADMARYTGMVALDSVTVQGPASEGGLLRMGTIGVDYDLGLETGLALGAMRFDIDRIAVPMVGLEMQGFGMRSAMSEPSAGQIDSGYEIGLEHFSLDALGTPLDLTNVTFATVIRGLSRSAYEGYMDFAPDLAAAASAVEEQASGAGEDEASPPPEMPPEVIEQGMALIGEALEDGLGMDLTLGFGMADLGTADAAITLDLADGTTLEMMAVPDTAQQALSGRTSLAISRDLTVELVSLGLLAQMAGQEGAQVPSKEQVATLAAATLDQIAMAFAPLIRFDETGLSHEATLESGMVTIEGMNPIPLSQLAALFMPQQPQPAQQTAPGGASPSPLK